MQHTKKRTGGMVQEVECLPSKPEALNSKPRIEKKKKKLLLLSSLERSIWFP
jgi:hypothetical protein